MIKKALKAVVALPLAVWFLATHWHEVNELCYWTRHCPNCTSAGYCDHHSWCSEWLVRTGELPPPYQ